MKPLFFILIFGVASIIYAGGTNPSWMRTSPPIDAKQKVEAYKAAVESGYFSITTNEEAKIKRELDEYDQGRLGLTNLNEDAGAEGNRELIGYYLLHTNDISVKFALLFSRTYAGCGLYSESAKLTAKYLNVYPNDSYGWRLLGNANLLLGATQEAIDAYSRAVRLGDNPSIEPLAGLALESHRPGLIQPFIPKIIKLRQSENVPKRDRYNLTSILLSYALNIQQKEIFLKTLKGENLKELMQDEALKQDIISGIKLFKGKDIDKIRKMVNDIKSQNSKPTERHT